MYKVINLKLLTYFLSSNIKNNSTIFEARNISFWTDHPLRASSRSPVIKTPVIIKMPINRHFFCYEIARRLSLCPTIDNKVLLIGRTYNKRLLLRSTLIVAVIPLKRALERTKNDVDSVKSETLVLALSLKFLSDKNTICL